MNPYDDYRERIGEDPLQESPRRTSRPDSHNRGPRRYHPAQAYDGPVHGISPSSPAGMPYGNSRASGYSIPMSSMTDAQSRSHSQGVVHADVGQVRNLKNELGFSTGLAKALAVSKDAFLYRIWVIDNSGSMQIGDGHRVVPLADGKIKGQAVTRWEELQDAITYHSQIAAILGAPSIFTLLNDPGEDTGRQQFTVSVNRKAPVEDDLRKARTLMQRVKPAGVTPLTPHIRKIQQTVQQLAPRLRREGKRVAIILATDGLPTDEEGYGGEEIREDFVQALRALEGLPVWLVIRLCTDEAEVTDFYNALDGRLELSLEVLDDFLGEAKEVHRMNKWLNYGLPLHRCRELGYQDRLFDLLDERPLTKGELRDFCALLFGTDVEEIPDPVVDWKEFLKYIQASSTLEKEHWDPVRKKVGPWINLKVLHKVYGKGKCTIM